MENQDDSLIDVLALVYKRRKLIISVTLITAFLTAGLSLLLPNYYEASTQFYAASPDLAQPSPLGNLPDNKQIYGTDQDIDRLISISKSNTIQNYLIDSFDLYNHYKIKEEDPKAKYRLLLKLNKLYNTTKTKYDAIRLSVEDKDPQVAMRMANAARTKIDSLAREMIKSSQRKLIDSYKSSQEEKQAFYSDIQDSLYQARVIFGIFNTQSQGEAYGASIVELEGSIQSYAARVKMLKNMTGIPSDSIAMSEAKLYGFRNQYQNLKKSIDAYNSGYPLIVQYERELKDFGDQLNLDKERLKQLKAIYNSNVSALHVVEKADIPVIKSRPKRSYIVIGATILCAILMTLWVVVVDQINNLNWREKFKNA